MMYMKGTKKGAIAIIIAPDTTFNYYDWVDDSYKWEQPKYVTYQHACEVCNFFKAPIMPHKVLIILQKCGENGIIETKTKILD